MVLRREFTSPSYASDHVRVEYIAELRSVVLTLCATPRPCVTRLVLDGLRSASNWIRQQNALQPESIRHMILASDRPGVFSLGGDLDLFVHCIETGNRDWLLAYALDCVRIGHGFYTGFDGTVSTTAVIAGQAMGGGLEGAACCQTIVVERGSTLQLPEIKFGMFPGMGAISYLSRRIPGVQVRRMVEEGEPVNLEEAYAIRMIDALTEPGDGLRTAHRINAKLNGAFHGHVATRLALAQAQGPSLAELEAIAAAWVDVAFKVERRDMRLMNRLASQQLRLGALPNSVVRPVPEQSFGPLLRPQAPAKLKPADAVLI